MTEKSEENSELQPFKRIAVVGAGAVGGYYGARLAQAGQDVTFLLRSDYEHVRQHGLNVQSVAGDFHLPDVQCVRDTRELGPVDLVLMAWKTTSNHLYEEVISPLLHDETLVLTLQNGLGNCELLADLFGPQRVFGGLCFICSNRVAPGEIRHTASGQVRVGKYQADQPSDVPSAGSEKLEAVVSQLRHGGIDCRGVANLEHAQWMKLVWNIPFNGLAISEGGVDTQTLLETSGMEGRIRKIMHEVQAVAAALGHEIEDHFIDQQVEVTRTMKAYRPSSMIDFVEGRQVEVDAIWREPFRRAQALGVEVPEIERLLGQIEIRLGGDYS
ncbi:2-dehydropantoate 2-reductase [Verrucomicrobiaceae bacterium N1E253]|uniref:2-dehydropantoate 2-reductase n=1 Tax=Oceaniferula marina TaxID=2748318 RepID=A0A851GLH0_9BACT|nr:2-dehydropantoate 2-reductase [Oceaniferula marina]NWK56681.1 2-dehydropantoate 2-reductase [Oceaniferula marina]